MLRRVEVAIIPCFKDNYGYLLPAPGRKTAVIVDATRETPAQAARAAPGLTLRAIPPTHHHPDHVDGNSGLVARYPGIPVYGSAHDRGRIPEQTHFVNDEEVVQVLGFTFRCLLVPGHTL